MRGIAQHDNTSLVTLTIFGSELRMLYYLNELVSRGYTNYRNQKLILARRIWERMLFTRILDSLDTSALSMLSPREKASTIYKIHAIMHEKVAHKLAT